MLILARNAGQSIVIDGRIVVKFLSYERGQAKIGVEADPSIPVHREEVHLEIVKEQELRKSTDLQGNGDSGKVGPCDNSQTTR